MENSTDRALKLFIVLSRSCKVILDEAHKLIDQYGLNPTEFAVLELLYHKGKTTDSKNWSKNLTEKRFDDLCSRPA